MPEELGAYRNLMAYGAIPKDQGEGGPREWAVGPQNSGLERVLEHLLYLP